ncbi:DUF6281 family protein [Streptomyces sp. NPDC055006]
MTWVGRSVAMLLTAAVAMSTGACTSGDSDGGAAAASCVYQFEYKGQKYRAVANIDFVVGDELGTATQPPCEDTGGTSDAGEARETKTAYEVDGITSKVAIAVGDSPKNAMLLVSYSGKELPPEVKKLIDGS